MTVSDYLHSKASRERVPINGTFELSPVCNFACKMCYVRRTPEQIRAEGKRVMDWTDWLDMAKQCRDAGTLYLLLTGGEPFLYPNFRQLYTQLHKMGFLLSINSNGTLIDEETVDWLKEYAPTRVNITLYGASRESYRRLCGHADGFRRAARAVDLLKEAGIPVVINHSVVPENRQDMAKVIAFGKQRNINTRVATYMFPPARREQEVTDSRFTPQQSAQAFLERCRLQLTEESYRKTLAENQALPQESGEDWGTNQGEDMACRAGRSSFWISWDGTMTACGITAFPRKEYPFRDGFENCWQRLTDAVRAATVLSGCSGCPKKHVCHPCVAMAEAETGDPNKAPPYLCQMTDCILKLSKELWEDPHG